MEGARLLIVEDHRLLAESVAIALRMEGACVDVVHPACDRDVLDAAHRSHPQLVLLDLELGLTVSPGHLFVEPLRQLGANVLIVTGTDQLVGVAEAIQCGAVGYVDKKQAFSDLLDHVQRAAAGELVLPATERTRLLLFLRAERVRVTAQQHQFAALTRREALVLAELMEGRTAEEIAASAVVSLNTVRTQMRAVREKLGVTTQLAAVVLAYRSGWQPPTG